MELKQEIEIIQKMLKNAVNEYLNNTSIPNNLKMKTIFEFGYLLENEVWIYHPDELKYPLIRKFFDNQEHNRNEIVKMSDYYDTIKELVADGEEPQELLDEFEKFILAEKLNSFKMDW